MKEKMAMLEAILFTTDKPLNIKEIAKKMNIRPEAVDGLISELREKYKHPLHGITLSEMGGYKLSVKATYLENVSDLTPHADLRRGLLRVLAIIAFHEPVKQSDIVKVIGNRTYEYIKELKDRGLIKSDTKGRTRILTTTPHFEEYFGIKKQELKEILKEKSDDRSEEKIITDKKENE